MVNGRLRCLGSAQHLKHRFGNGFEVNIKTQHASEHHMVEILAAMAAKNPVAAQAMTVNGQSQDVEAGGQHYDSHFFSRQDIEAIAYAMNVPSRLQNLSSSEVLSDALQNENKVSLRIFLEWWHSETIFETLHGFMRNEFGERAALLERSGAHSFRYRIKRTDMQGQVVQEDDNASSGNGLSDIFAKFEAAKESLQVKEYSVGQTTLEQIFNQFAGAQDNPEVAAQQQQQQRGPPTVQVSPSPPVVAVAVDSK